MDFFLYIFECLGVQFHELCIYIKMCLNRYLQYQQKSIKYHVKCDFMYICIFVSKIIVLKNQCKLRSSNIFHLSITSRNYLDMHFYIEIHLKVFVHYNIGQNDGKKSSIIYFTLSSNLQKLFSDLFCFSFKAAVVWLKYCRHGVKYKTINQ